MIIFGNKVAELGAEALILSLTTSEELGKNPKAKKDKEWYVDCRNRVLAQLRTQTEAHPEMKQHIIAIETFFEELDGKKERETPSLGWTQFVQKKIESEIVNSIVKSLKQKDDAGEATKDAIIAKARETATEIVIKRMEVLFSKLQGTKEPVLEGEPILAAEL